MTEFHDEFTELLGAYALDAVDDPERQAIDAHLQSCHWCATEVVEYREVAAFLSQSGADAPDGVWDRIAAELSPPAPPVRMSFSPVGEVDALGAHDATSPVVADGPAASAASAQVSAPDNVVTLSERRSVRRTTMLAALSVAALLLAVVGFVAVDQYRSADSLRDQAANITTPGPGDLTMELEGSDRQAGAQVMVNDQGRGYLVSHDLPDPGKDQLYQLWGQVDNVVLSLGTFGSGTDVVNFQIDPNRIGDVEAFAVTQEQNPGVLASENDPVLIGDGV